MRLTDCGRIRRRCGNWWAFPLSKMVSLLIGRVRLEADGGQYSSYEKENS